MITYTNMVEQPKLWVWNDTFQAVSHHCVRKSNCHLWYTRWGISSKSSQRDALLLINKICRHHLQVLIHKACDLVVTMYVFGWKCQTIVVDYALVRRETQQWPNALTRLGESTLTTVDNIFSETHAWPCVATSGKTNTLKNASCSKPCYTLHSCWLRLAKQVTHAEDCSGVKNLTWY